MPSENCASLFKKLLTACADTETCIELNTAGLRKDCAEIYPSLTFLKLARSAGVQITFGSDAHAPEELGLNLADATDLAREAGYVGCCRFDRRGKSVFPF